MRRYLVGLVVVLMLLVGSPALGHTNYGHSHSCASSHPMDMDGTNYKHSADLILGNGPQYSWIRGYHKVYEGNEFYWVLAHSQKLYC